MTVLLDRNGCRLGHMNGPAEWDSEDGKRLIEAAIEAARLDSNRSSTMPPQRQCRGTPPFTGAEPFQPLSAFNGKRRMALTLTVRDVAGQDTGR